MSTCSKCGGHIFEITEQEPSGSRFKVYFVQCTSCNTPIGIMDYFDTNSSMKNIEIKLGNLQNSLDQIQHDISNINSDLRR